MYFDLKRFSLWESEPGGESPSEEGGGVVPAEETPSIEERVGTIPISVLPEDFQNLPEDQLQFMLGRLVSSTTDANKRNRELEEQIQTLRDTPPPVVEPTEPDPHEGKDINEIFSEDPEAAITAYFKKRGIGQVVTDTQQKISNLTLSQVRRDIPDFGEFEDEVRGMLQGRADISAEQYTGAYYMALGAKTAEDNDKKRRALNSPEVPSSDSEAPKEVFSDLTGAEKEIFEASGMSRESWENHKNPDSWDVKVPIGGGKEW